MAPLTGRKLAPRVGHGTGLSLVREQVLHFFQQAEARHWSAEGLYKLFIAEGETFGINAVRRALAELELVGVLVRRHFGGGPSLFELDDRPSHDHLICKSCGAIEDFIEPAADDRWRPQMARQGFTLNHHTWELYGLCRKPGCSVQAAT